MYKSKAEPVDLQQDGVLWYINRVAFHPRGFALGYDPQQGWVLLGDGKEVWAFEDSTEDDKFARIEALFERIRREAEDD